MISEKNMEFPEYMKITRMTNICRNVKYWVFILNHKNSLKITSHEVFTHVIFMTAMTKDSKKER